MEFNIGQRWISHSETELGLGIITEVANRRVKILYPASAETRVYAIENAPLSRIQYNLGDTVSDSEDLEIVITSINEQDGLLIYQGQTKEGHTKQIHELDLSAYVSFTTPLQRLYSGQLDKNKNYSLRVQTLYEIHRLQQSSIKGLLGTRTDLLPHQVYIANNVANRYAPRVLLADEVGLGKTIEAGMILHHQLLTGKASRVLILVPDSLIHQWLVEMLRKFNLNFSIFDSQRVNDLFTDESTNPFETEQKIICPLSIITSNDIFLQLLTSCGWDTIVVDEAHHLSWSPANASIEYQAVEQLSQVCKSLLLLTATPEQVGFESHFARLRLLDPARFHSLSEYKTEQQGLKKLNTLIQRLLVSKTITAADKDTLESYLGDSISETLDENISKLLDLHGTGRVLFRNSRSTVKGFPKRILNPAPLDIDKSSLLNPKSLYPESELEEAVWLETDPRVTWLVKKLKELKPNKVLVICHHAQTAVSLDNYLNLRMGIRSTSFYQGLSIVERDRAAAYFSEGANPEELDSGDGAQVLICSEIGSEGRNFQFAHHLILFDLALNPDLLEQRIGRLDRIGQKHDVQIHVPYLCNTAQEVLFNWVHRGINLFSQSCSAGYEIYKHYAKDLNSLIEQCPLYSQEKLDELIEDTAVLTHKTLQEHQEGRDKLLELNSCKPSVAKQIIQKIEDYDNPQALSEYMELVFDQFGVDSEFHSEHSYVLYPSEHMHEIFPGLKDEGNTITFDRKKALSREDMEFLSWEHPMVMDSMDMIINGEFGNTALAMINLESIPKGTFFLEAWYTINTIADKSLQIDRYLPLHPTRVLIDSSKKDYSSVLPYEKLTLLCSSLPKKTALAIAEKTRKLTQQLVEHTQNIADEKLTSIKQDAKLNLKNSLNSELERLIKLKKINPSIREEEIEHIKHLITISSEHIDLAKYKLQAIRLIINN